MSSYCVCVYIQVLNPEPRSLTIYIHPAVPRKPVFSCIITRSLTALPPCSPCTPSLFLLFRHFELFASLSSQPTSSPSPPWALQPPSKPPPPTPYCEFWRLDYFFFSFLNFNSILNTNTQNIRGGVWGCVRTPRLHYLHSSRRLYTTVGVCDLLTRR